MKTNLFLAASLIGAALLGTPASASPQSPFLLAGGASLAAVQAAVNDARDDAFRRLQPQPLAEDRQKLALRKRR